MILSIVIGFLLLLSFTAGFRNSRTMDFILFVKPLNHPFFHFGLSCTREIYQEEIVDVVSIGLFFVSMEFAFHKDLSHFENY